MLKYLHKYRQGREADKLLFFPEAFLSLPVLNSMTNTVKTTLIKRGKCTHCSFPPATPPRLSSKWDGSEFLKGAGPAFIYCELRMAVI